MKLELMDFQNNAVDLLIKRLKQAKRDLEDGDPQAVILSSPPAPAGRPDKSAERKK